MQQSVSGVGRGSLGSENQVYQGSRTGRSVGSQDAGDSQVQESDRPALTEGNVPPGRDHPLRQISSENSLRHSNALGMPSSAASAFDSAKNVMEALRSKHSYLASEPEGSMPIKEKGSRDVEGCVPIVYGTMAFWLGKKATESQSHKWTIYVQGASNADLSVVMIKQVIFHLHPSFKNPQREVDSPPFELSGCGWGKSQIAISIVFHTDVSDKRLTLYHQLKLYSEDKYCPPSVKKSAVVESYEEIVFSDPAEAFLARVHDHPALTVQNLPADFILPHGKTEDNEDKKWGDTKDHSLSQWFTNFSEADELLKLAAARQQVQAYIAKLKDK